MTAPRITASGLWRVDACAASASLPRWATRHADAVEGTAAHAVVETEVVAAGGLAEVPMAYDVRGTARLLPKRGHRDYGELAPTEIPGTADQIEVLADRVVITDVKSGFGYMVAPCATNLQLQHNALAASIIYDKPAATVRIVDGDGREKDRADFDAFDFVPIAAKLRSIWERAHAPNPRPVVGDHCWRCESIRACPPHREVLVALGSGAAPSLLPSVDLTPHLVGETWPIRNMARRMLAMYDAAVEAVVSNSGPILLADGRELRLVATEREALDGATAYEVLRTQHGEAVAAKAVEMTTTKAALERAISTIAPKGSKAAYVRAALEAIREAGGARTTPGKPKLQAINCIPGALPSANEEAA